MSEVMIHCLYDKLVDPKELKDHPLNRNKHGDDQIERLSKLYKYHGIRHPIMISNVTGYIVAGHGRKLAAIRAGIEHVPVVYQDFDNSDQEYAFIQSDNAIANWAELDFGAINMDLQNLDPSFNIDNLGIKNFTLDYSEKSFLDVNKSNENEEWVGMPEFEEGKNYIKLIFHFETEEARKQFVDDNEIEVTKKLANQWLVKV